MANDKKATVVSIFRICCTLHAICPIFDLLFDTHACRHYGTINLLSALTSEAVKYVLDSQSEEETWGVDSLDILLETWNVILGVLPFTFARNSIYIFVFSFLHNLIKCFFTITSSNFQCDMDYNRYFIQFYSSVINTK